MMTAVVLMALVSSTEPSSMELAAFGCEAKVSWPEKEPGFNFDASGAFIYL